MNKQVEADSYTREIRELVSSSPYFLRIADGILENLDRQTLAELLAGYFYFKSEGRSNREFGYYVFRTQLLKILKIAAGTVSVIFAGVLADSRFRKEMFRILKSTLGEKPHSPTAEVLLQLSSD